MIEDPILAALARLEGGQTAMRDEAAGFREQVLNRLTAIREDIGLNMARVDRVAENRNRHSRREHRALSDDQSAGNPCGAHRGARTVTEGFPQ